jgi:hypothetical protein
LNRVHCGVHEMRAHAAPKHGGGRRRRRRKRGRRRIRNTPVLERDARVRRVHDLIHLELGLRATGVCNLERLSAG